MTVRELLERIDSAELSEWLAYDRIDPFDDGYWQAGMIAATVANAMGSGKRTYRPADFMPRPARQREQTPAEMKVVMESAIARHVAALAAQKPKKRR